MSKERNIDDSDLAEVTGGTGILSNIDGSGIGGTPVGDDGGPGLENPSSPGGGATDPEAEGGSGGTSEMI